MKKTASQAFLILLMVIGGIQTTNAQIPRKFRGIWEHTAPSAAKVHQTGIMEIKKDSVITIFTGNPEKHPSSLVFESDTLKYIIYLSDLDLEVNCKLIMEDRSTLKGSAEWGWGESTLTLNRKKDKELK